jgi:hypothetical protein
VTDGSRHRSFGSIFPFLPFEQVKRARDMSWAGKILPYAYDGHFPSIQRTNPVGSRLTTASPRRLVVDLLFANPIVTVRHVMGSLDVSQPGASNLLRRLGAEGIVQEVGTGPGVRHRWVCRDVLKVLDPESGP